METKKWYQSRTMWLAIFTALTGAGQATQDLISTGQLGEVNPLIMMGTGIAMAWLRKQTNTAVK